MLVTSLSVFVVCEGDGVTVPFVSVSNVFETDCVGLLVDFAVCSCVSTCEWYEDSSCASLGRTE